MITDEQIIFSSIVVVLVGIFLLYIFVESIEPKYVTELDDSLIGVTVKVNGTINKIKEINGHCFIEIDDIKVVVFSNIAKRYPYVYNLSKNDFINVVGEVSKYKGELEIIAKEVWF